MTHELVHAAFPDVAEEHHWIEEGIATYVEPIARVQIGDLTPEKILDYMATRQADGAAGATINREVLILARAMSVKFEGVQKLEENGDIGRALSREEEERLIEAAAKSASKVLHTIVRIALATGTRHDEIRLLQWSQIDFERKLITVGRTKPGGGEGRQIPIGPALEGVLEAYLSRYAAAFGPAEPDWYVFPVHTRRLWIDPKRPIQTFGRAWGSLRKAAEVQCRFQ